MLKKLKDYKFILAQIFWFYVFLLGLTYKTTKIYGIEAGLMTAWAVIYFILLLCSFYEARPK